MKKQTKKIVVVRTYSAGVHVGVLVSQKDGVRVWQWRGAKTPSELSQKIDDGDDYDDGYDDGFDE